MEEFGQIGTIKFYIQALLDDTQHLEMTHTITPDFGHSNLMVRDQELGLI
jgi:hypothetical protein